MGLWNAEGVQVRVWICLKGRIRVTSVREGNRRMVVTVTVTIKLTVTVTVRVVIADKVRGSYEATSSIRIYC